MKINQILTWIKTHKKVFVGLCISFCLIISIIIGIVTHQHKYDHDCDNRCNICYAKRDIVHIDNDLNKLCDICDTEYVEPTISDNVYAAITNINNFLNWSYNPTYQLSFSDIKVSSSDKKTFYTSVTKINDNFFLLERNNGDIVYRKYQEYGTIDVVKYGDKLTGAYHLNYDKVYQQPNDVVKITLQDIEINQNTITVKSNAAKNVLMAWINTSQAQYQFTENLAIDFTVVKENIQNADANIYIELSEDGQIIKFEFKLYDPENPIKTYYEVNYNFENNKHLLKATIKTVPTTHVQFQLIDNKPAVSVAKGEHWYAAVAQININNNVQEIIVPEDVANLFKTTQDNMLAEIDIRQYYPIYIDCNLDCSEVFTYDVPTKQYIQWTKNNKQFVLAAIVSKIDTNFCCLGNFNQSTITIDSVKHSLSEKLSHKYSETYTLQTLTTPTPKYVAIWDKEFSMYIYFIEYETKYILSHASFEHNTEIPLYQLNENKFVKK